MAWAYRATSFASSVGVFNTGVSTNERSVAMGAAVSAADCLFVLSLVYPTTGTATPATPTVTDSVNGSWAAAIDTVTYLDGTTHVEVDLFAFPNSGAGTPTVHVVSAGTNQGGFVTAAYSGLATSAPQDVEAQGTGTGGTASGTNTAATHAANELVLGLWVDDGWNQANDVAAAGWTQRGHVINSAFAELNFCDQDSGAISATPHFALAVGNPGGTTVTWAILTAVMSLSGAVVSNPAFLNRRTLRMAG